MPCVPSSVVLVSRVRKSFAPDTSRAWVDIDLDALVRNARSFAARTGVPLVPMLKADGYGLGAVAVARALSPCDPWGFGVGTLDEARELHVNGVLRPVIIFSPLVPDLVDLTAAVAARPTIGDLAALQAWLARSGGLPFHLEVDTGMGRSGFPWHDASLRDAVRNLLQDAAGWEGVFTHFHSSDWDPAATETQWQRFQEWLAGVGRRPGLVHAANSGAGRYGRQYAGDLTRPGLHLYGGRIDGLEAVPVMALRARIVALRQLGAGESVSYDATWRPPAPTTVATLGIGYADGLPRSLSNGGAVEVLGRRLRIVGRVTMDHTVIDVGDLPVSVGDVATLIGGSITLEEQAMLAGTVGYEILTGLGARLPRSYHRED